MDKTLRVRDVEAWQLRAVLARERVTARVRPAAGFVDVVVPEEGMAAARVALDLHGLAHEEVGDERG